MKRILLLLAISMALILLPRSMASGETPIGTAATNSTMPALINAGFHFHEAIAAADDRIHEVSTSSAQAIATIGPIISRGNNLRVDVWTNRSQDEIYAPGEMVHVWFRANDDCHVTIYGIGSDGEVEILFPRYPDDGFVFGGMTYQLSEYYDAWSYRARGPDGVVYLHAVASRSHRPFRYGVRRGNYHLDINHVVGDPFLAINNINRRLTSASHLHAKATVSYFIGRRVWYPRYACYDCHGRNVRFDPYATDCPRYVVRLARDYDYWWAYDYYPRATHRLMFAGPFWKFELRAVPVHRYRPLRYVDCALGYRNYRPVRAFARPPHVAVYASPVLKTRRDYQKSYERISYSDTRTRVLTGSDGTRVRSSGVTRTPDRNAASTRSRSDVSSGTSTRSRSDVSPGTSTRSRSDVSSGTSTRSRSDVSPGTSTRSRSDVSPGTSTRSRSDISSGTSTRSRSDVSPGTSTRSRSDISPGTSTRSRPDVSSGTSTRSRSDISSGTSTRSRSEAAAGDATRGITRFSSPSPDRQRSMDRANTLSPTQRSATRSISSPTRNRESSASRGHSGNEAGTGVSRKGHTDNDRDARTGNRPVSRDSRTSRVRR
ncbi:MAG: DUF4384 domain-containing protein [Bacteroidetes bacterium]|nr:DUF4384 domain-containing protein [Bacteroidota bacterium]